jgi:hypothetical protein
MKKELREEKREIERYSKWAKVKVERRTEMKRGDQREKQRKKEENIGKLMNRYWRRDIERKRYEDKGC